MSASLRWAIWPQVVAISLIGLGAASCTDSQRFSSFMGSDSAARSDDGSIPQGAPAPGADSDRIDGKPMPPVATADGEGAQGGGRGMASHAPGASEVTGSVRSVAPSQPPPPAWTWEGGTPIIVGQGETLDSLSRKYGVPAYAIMQANNITSPGAIHAGQHLVIPRRRSPTASATPPRNEPPRTQVAAKPAPSNEKRPPRTARGDSTVHVVAPGETLNSIARRYGKPVMVLARASNIPPDTMVRVGQHIVIPDVRRSPHAEAKRPKAPAAHKVAKRRATHPEVATTDSPHSAFKASTVPPPAPQAPVKVAGPAGALPSFRWPVRGRVITGFGPRPNGLQNDGIDLAVPQGTPIKAADDGVVAYAGNELKGYGNLVLIRHSNGYVTAYAHASQILVRRGETVKRGQVIAKSGETGGVNSPELHFEIRKGATPVDPAQFLKGA
jgi:murein DD-endopeptidase MepM/ murein hydrolase activator NlpD